MNKERTERGKIDWLITLLPLGVIIVLCCLFFFEQEKSNVVLGSVK